MKSSPIRQGPSPFFLLLAIQTATLVGSRNALPHLKDGLQGWNQRLRPKVEQFIQELDGVDEDEFAHALENEAKRRQEGFIRGVGKYRSHPWRRDDATDAKIIWRDGTTVLLDYSEDGAKGPPVLVVPSLINRAYILDLSPERSLMRFLAQNGFRPYLIDWSEPGVAEKGFSFDDYIGGRLSAALSTILKKDGPPIMLGYCLGGLFALALSVMRQQDVKGLALLATPWNFHQPDEKPAKAMHALRPMIDDLVRLYGILPAETLQCFFSMIDPGSIERKFRMFGAMAQDSQRARMFVMLEDWLNDSVPLPARAARQCLYDWCADNIIAKGEWSVSGERICASSFKKPVLAIIPQKDRIVPPESALALLDELPHAEKIALPTGHVGMIAGVQAKSATFAPIANWINRVA